MFSAAIQHAGLAASGLSLVMSSLGLAVVWQRRAWAQRHSVWLVAFAAGLLLAASCLHLIPESLALTPHAGVFVLAGYAALALISRLGSGRGTAASNSAAVAFLGIGVHSTLDGLIYVISYSHGIHFGALATSGLIVHEFSEAVVLFVLLKQTGMTTVRTAALTFFGSALTTPAGALMGIAGLGFLPNTATLIGPLLGISAGALLLVAASQLLSHFNQRSLWGQPFSTAPVVMFLAGTAVSLTATVLKHL